MIAAAGVGVEAAMKGVRAVDQSIAMLGKQVGGAALGERCAAVAGPLGHLEIRGPGQGSAR